MIVKILGAFVPVGELDFGCVGVMRGGELRLKRSRLDPAGEIE